MNRFKLETMKDKLIKVIAEYLEGDTMDRFKKIYANRLHIKVTLGDIFRYQIPPNPWPNDCVAIKSRREEIAFLESELEDLKNEIAAEIAGKLLAVVEQKTGWEDAPEWATWRVIDENENIAYSAEFPSKNT